MSTWRILIWLVVLANLTISPYLFYLLIVSIAALMKRGRQKLALGAERLFQIVIPAHNEERCIAKTVASCRDQDYPSNRCEVIVIADNCDDQTAVLARQAGACVVHRQDAFKRSKGHALAYYFNQPGSLNGLDAVVVIDADTLVDRGLLQGLSGYLNEGHDWVQV